MNSQYNIRFAVASKREEGIARVKTQKLQELTNPIKKSSKKCRSEHAKLKNVL
jgi:hypothetical protein